MVCIQFIAVVARSDGDNLLWLHAVQSTQPAADSIAHSRPHDCAGNTVEPRCYNYGIVEICY